MGSWNYRLVRHKSKLANVPDFLQVHEVHYDDHGNVTNVAQIGARIAGDNVEEIRLSLKMIGEALEKPILDYPGDDH